MPPASRNRWIALTAGALVLIGIVGASLARYFSGEATHEARPIPVKLAPVAMQTFSERIEALGTALAEESVTITARVTETVTSLPFEEGQRVERAIVLQLFERTILTDDPANPRSFQIERANVGTDFLKVAAGPVVPGDTIDARIDGLPPLTVTIGPPETHQEA